MQSEILQEDLGKPNGNDAYTKDPIAPLKENPYEISVTELALYFHLSQFLPLLGIALGICLLFLIFTSISLLSMSGIAFILYVVLYKISTRAAEKRAKTVTYSFAENVLTAEDKYCGFFSQKSISLQQVVRITLFQTPLMRYCKIWSLKFELAGGVASDIYFYGLAEPVRAHEKLINARSKLFDKTLLH